MYEVVVCVGDTFRAVFMAIQPGTGLWSWTQGQVKNCGSWVVVLLWLLLPVVAAAVAPAALGFGLVHPVQNLQVQHNVSGILVFLLILVSMLVIVLSSCDASILFCYCVASI